MTTGNNVTDQDLESLNAQIRQQSAELKGDLFLLIARTADVFNRYLDCELNKRNSNRANFAILHNLITHDGSMTPTELTKKVFRSKHSITRAIDSLEKEGLVKRRAVKGDRRLTSVRITKKGLEFVATKFADRQEIVHQALSGLNKKQSKELKKTLEILEARLLKVTPIVW